MLSHGGGTSGFISRNVIFPDQRVAIVVLTNSDAADAATPIADDIEKLVFEQVTPTDKARLHEARQIFEGLRKGNFDRNLLSPNANDYYTPKAIKEISQSIAGLGAIKSFELKESGTRGGMDYRVYDVDLARKSLQLVTRSLPDSKIEQYMIMPR